MGGLPLACALALVAARVPTEAPRARLSSRFVPAPAMPRHSVLRGGVTAAAGTAAVDGAPLVVRVRTRDGVLRVSVPAGGSPTVADLQRLIEAQLGVPVAAQRSLAKLGASALEPSATLAAAGVAHGAMLELAYADGVSAGDADAPALGVPAAGSSIRRPRARKLDDLVAESAANSIVLDTPPDPACRFVSVDEESCAAFLRVCRNDGFSRPRAAFLYGRVVASGRTRRGVEVAAVHEVPLGADALTLAEPPAECARARALAAHLGLRRVGWMLARLACAQKLTAAEVCMAAKLQAKEGAEGAEAASCFVTLLATPRRTKPKARALNGGGGGGGGDELGVEAYQPTPACAALIASGKLRPARAAGGGADAAAEAAGLVEPTRAELAFVNANRAAWPDRTAPVEFFAARIFNVSQAQGWLGCAFTFTPEFRALTDGAGAELADEAVDELREWMRERQADPLDEVLLDWRLLLCVGCLLDDAQWGAACDAALEADTAELLRVNQLLHRRIAERIGDDADD
ncbi:hypothetical protein T492DRAFT_846075 [Pavlovales sp. CCMP2436]|nr:hypothetical protein T492DRAFT_846075 [Pavlovales sp. CCMP2436]